MKRGVVWKTGCYRMFSRVLSALLLLVLLVIPVDTVKAESVSSDEDFVIEDGVLIKYKGFASKVVIPEGVRAIKNGTWARDYTGLNWNNATKSVVLPSSLKELGDFAFCHCPNLSKIEMQEGVTKIGDQAFYGCKSLEKINIPKSVTYIASRYTFLDTPWLEKKQSEADLVVVNNTLVSMVSKKREITVPEGITRIADEAVVDDYCYIEKVYLPKSLQEIGDWAFSTAYGLDEVYMRDGVMKIGMYAFSCSLKELRIPESVKEIGDYCFFGVDELLVYKDSFAHNYVKENNLKYRVLDADPADEQYVTVKVQKGDSLWKIAREHLGRGIRYEEIVKLNHLKGTMIFVGQELKVPMK